MAAMRGIAESVRARPNPLTTPVMSSLSLSQQSLSRERLGLLLGFVGMAIFGGTLPATRIAVSQIDPIALTSLRTAIAGLCSLALLLVLRRPLPPRALWPQLVIAMLCVAVLFPLLMSMGMQTVDASHGGVVLGILPIATALVAVTIIYEQPRSLFWLASTRWRGAGNRVRVAPGRWGALDRRSAVVRSGGGVRDRLCVLRPADRADAGLGSH